MNELRDHMIDARRAFDRDVRSQHQLEMSCPFCGSWGAHEKTCPDLTPEFQTNADPGDETEEVENG